MPRQPIKSATAPRKGERLRRDLWVGFKPYGVGETKPNHYAEMARTIWENRRSPLRAWRVLTQGVCDGCALGRRRAARLDHRRRAPVHDAPQPAAPQHHAGARPRPPGRRRGAARAAQRRELRDLGRLPVPLLRERGDAGFRRITWDEALRAHRRAHPRQRAASALAFYLTSRGITNETYYVAQKVARFLGTNNIDNAARLCHSPSTGAMKRALGVAATHLQLPRLVGHRPDRLLRLQPGQRPAGGDEVPARGASASGTRS